MKPDDIPAILFLCAAGAVCFYFVVPWSPKLKDDEPKQTFPIARVVPRQRRR